VRVLSKYLTSVKTLLDVGCGTGRDIVPLAEKGLQILGIDTSKEYVNAAKEKLRSKGLIDKADLVIGDARALPFRHAFVDALVCMGNVLGDVGVKKQDRIIIIQEMIAAAKPEATFIIEFVHRYWKPADLLVWLFRYLATSVEKLGGKPLEFGDYVEAIKLDHRTVKLAFHAFTTKEATQLFASRTSRTMVEKRAKFFYDWFILVASRRTRTNKVL
jgi:ubiquinone/menaquinone biosynthesis C-methylase UbiE